MYAGLSGLRMAWRIDKSSSKELQGSNVCSNSIDSEIVLVATTRQWEQPVPTVTDGSNYEPRLLLVFDDGIE
jgi:hypothetical protein